MLSQAQDPVAGQRMVHLFGLAKEFFLEKALEELEQQIVASRNAGAEHSQDQQPPAAAPADAVEDDEL